MKRSLVLDLIENSKTVRHVPGEIGKVPYDSDDQSDNHISGKHSRTVDGKSGLGDRPKSKTVPQVQPPKSRERRRMTESSIGDAVMGFLMKFSGPKFGRKLYDQLKTEEPEMYRDLLGMFKELISKGAVTDRAQMNAIMGDSRAQHLAMKLRDWAQNKLPPEFDDWAAKKLNRLGGDYVPDPEDDEVDEDTLSAKAARHGRDIGKPGKNFSKISNSAAKHYGSKAAGNRVAGAVLAKMREDDVGEQDLYDTYPTMSNSHANQKNHDEGIVRRNGKKFHVRNPSPRMMEDLGDNPDAPGGPTTNTAVNKDEGQKNPAVVKTTPARAAKIGSAGDSIPNPANPGTARKLPDGYKGGASVSAKKLDEGLLGDAIDWIKRKLKPLEISKEFPYMEIMRSISDDNFSHAKKLLQQWLSANKLDADLPDGGGYSKYTRRVSDNKTRQRVLAIIDELDKLDSKSFQESLTDIAQFLNADLKLSNSIIGPILEDESPVRWPTGISKSKRMKEMSSGSATGSGSIPGSVAATHGRSQLFADDPNGGLDGEIDYVPQTVPEYIKALDAYMKREYYITWADAAGDIESIRKAIERGITPVEFADRFAEKMDLDSANDAWVPGPGLSDDF